MAQKVKFSLVHGSERQETIEGGLVSYRMTSDGRRFMAEGTIRWKAGTADLEQMIVGSVCSTQEAAEADLVGKIRARLRE